MLDVEFLMSPLYAPVLVYRYRSGFLRSKVKRAIECEALKQGLSLLARPADEMFYVPLFDDYYCQYDWPVGRAASIKKTIPQVISYLKCPDLPIALFAREGDRLFQDATWSEAEDACLVLEEPQVELSTVDPVLRYLEAQTDFVGEQNLLNQPKLSQYLLGRVEEMGSMELLEFIHIFEETILLYCDPVTNVFTAPLREEERFDRSLILGPARRLLDRHNVLDIQEMVKGFERKYRRGWSISNLVTEFHHVVRRLLAATQLDTGRQKPVAQIKRSEDHRCDPDKVRFRDDIFSVGGDTFGMFATATG